MAILELITTNLHGAPKREILNGREYLVVPAVLINPGVLNGSNGPLLYTEEENRKDPGSWNGMPLIAKDHPRDANGRSVSARNPKTLNDFGIGYAFNAHANGKLQVEAWFDAETTKRISPTIHQKILDGKPLELSTGLYTTNIPDRGTHNGREYIARATDYRPDHVAVFEDKVGACSNSDGCGVNINEKTPKQETQDMAKLSDNERKKLVDGIVSNCRCEDEKKDRETLNALEDAELQHVAAFVTNARKDQPNRVQPSMIRVIGEDGKTIETLELTDNAMTLGKTAQKKLLNELSDGELEDEMAARKKRKDDEEMETKKTKNEAQPTTENAESRLTRDEREAIEYGKRAMNQQRGTLIERLVENISEDDRSKHREKLSKLSLNELEDRVLYLPVANEEDEPEQDYSRPLYFAPSGPPTRNAQPDLPPDPLPVINVDYSQEAKRRA